MSQDCEKPLVTVCIPTFNVERTLPETLDSLVAQNYPRIKIKIFDNQSTDRTYEVAQSFAAQYPHIEVHQHPQNIGAEANFTHCLQSAEGEYTALFHADDVYSSDMLARQVGVMEADPQVGAVATHAWTINPEGRRTGERLLPSELKSSGLEKLDFKDLLRLSLKYGNFITCPSVLARTFVYRDEISIWKGEDFKTSADLDIWLRISQRHFLAFLNEPLMSYREASESMSYRLKGQRVEPHDLFLVLDSYLSDPETESFLSDQDHLHYEFLGYKDAALRTWNMIRSGRFYNLPIRAARPSSGKLLSLSLQSGFHRRIICATEVIWALALVVSLGCFFRKRPTSKI